MSSTVHAASHDLDRVVHHPIRSARTTSTSMRAHEVPAPADCGRVRLKPLQCKRFSAIGNGSRRDEKRRERAQRSRISATRRPARRNVRRRDSTTSKRAKNAFQKISKKFVGEGLSEANFALRRLDGTDPRLSTTHPTSSATLRRLRKTLASDARHNVTQPRGLTETGKGWR